MAEAALQILMEANVESLIGTGRHVTLTGTAIGTSRQDNIRKTSIWQLVLFPKAEEYCSTIKF